MDQSKYPAEQDRRTPPTPEIRAQVFREKDAREKCGRPCNDGGAVPSAEGLPKR